MTEPVFVELSTSELFRAALVGVHRQIRALEKARQHRSPILTGDAWGNHIEGACGECAFAKHAGVYWDGSPGTFKRYGDVAGIEVRTRRYPSYQLLIRPDDYDERRFVLMRGLAPRFEPVGWCLAADAKRAEWLQTHGGGEPAYFVPDKFLTSVDTVFTGRR